MSNQDRNAELGKIHIGAKQLGMDPSDKDPESSYRTMLYLVAGVRTSAKLNQRQRHDVIKYQEKCGVVFKRKKRPTVAADKKAQVAKINAMLIATGKKETYADAIAKRMFKVERFEWCTAEQLGKVIAAIAINNRKNDIDEA